MRVTHLSLADYRNYEIADVEFHLGFNLIVGRNGQGKTNLVEAVAFFASLSSHRVSGISSLIRAGQESAIMRMRVAVRDRSVLLESQLNRGSPNRAQVNSQQVRPRELPRWFSSVLFAPEDLAIVRGEPGLRRRFLDEAICLRNPAFIGVLADYDRVLKQRTSLLKSARASGSRKALEATLPIWNEQLIQLGSTIMLARRNLVRDIAAPLARSYELLVENDHSPRLSLEESALTAVPESAASRSVSRETSTIPSHEDVSRETSSSIDAREVSRETLAAQFASALQRVEAQEYERGVTLIGPHRDDLFCELNDLPVKGFASHGESWSFVLGLRIALAELLRADSPSGDPVLILDDVFAELDMRRRQKLLEAVESFEQVIVTAAVEEDVPAAVLWNRIEIQDGRVMSHHPTGETHDD